MLAAAFLLLAAIDWKPIDAALGRAGSEQPGGVYRVPLPRGSWAAFKHGGGKMTMVMGDLALAESEVNPVIDALLGGGIAVTAIHNHLLNDTPRLTYVHFHGMGSDVGLAKVLRTALARTAPPPPAAPAPLDLPTAELDRILGRAGKANNGIYQFAVPRAETIRDDGMEIPPAMGTATAINFQPAGGGRAAITGDFVMTAAEVDPVMRALRGGGIAVTALHSHMIGETPRLFFMHFWASDDAVKLAKTLRAALDRMHVKQ